MERRTFLIQASAAAMAAACSGGDWAQGEAAVEAELTLREGQRTVPVPLNLYRAEL